MNDKIGHKKGDPRYWNWLCSSCASVQAPSGDSPPVCQSCGETLDRERYMQVMEVAGELTRHGYQYRRRYELDEAAGTRGKKYYLITFGPELDWIALAVMKAVASGLAWDATKQIIRKIRSEIRLVSSLRKQEKEILENEEEFGRFLDYVRDAAEEAEPRLSRAELDSLLNRIDLSG